MIQHCIFGTFGKILKLSTMSSGRVTIKTFIIQLISGPPRNISPHFTVFKNTSLFATQVI